VQEPDFTEHRIVVREGKERKRRDGFLEKRRHQWVHLHRMSATAIDGIIRLVPKKTEI